MTGDVGTASANHIRRRIGLARVVAVAVIASVGGHASGASFFHEVGVSVAMPTGVVVAVSYAPTFSVLDDRLRVGIGSRASAYFDDSTVDYPNGDPGLLAAGAHNTLSVQGPRSYALDAMVSASIRVVSGLELGMNIDVVGLGTGPPVKVAYAGADPRLRGRQGAAPTTFNLLLLGTHDRGQLDSEFFVAWWSDRWGVRAGVSHMSTEYTTARPLDGGNDRFRASATRLFVAAAWRFR